MTTNFLALLAAAIAQAEPPPSTGVFNPPTVRAGTAALDTRYHGIPVRVCGIPLAPAGYGPNTYVLSEFNNYGLLVQVTTKPPTLADPCVTGVILRTDGITDEAARRLGRRLTPGTHSADDIRTLYECGDQESCDALVAAVERRSAEIVAE